MPVKIEITDKYFPAFLAGKALDVEAAELIVRTKNGASVAGFRLKLDGAEQTGFVPSAQFGNLPSKDIATALAAGIIGEHTFIVANAGGLAPVAPAAGDVSPLDVEKVADILLYVETQVTSST